MKARLKTIIHDKRGSVSIVSCFLFGALLIMVVTLFAASRSTVGESYADAAFQLAGRSILSEYDNTLFREYGIIAFKGDEKQIEKDIKFYSGASIKSDNWAYIPFKPSVDTTSFFNIDSEVESNLKEYSIISVDIFEEQIKTALGKDILGIFAGEINGKNYQISDLKNGEPPKERTLRNQGVIESLPSNGYETSLLNLDFDVLTIPSISEIMDYGGKKFFATEYVMGFFSHANDNMYPENRFYDKEIEYIITGKKSESENYKHVKQSIWLARLSANVLAIGMDPKKRNIVLSLASPFAAAGGIGELLAIGIITGTWATAETNNDLKILEEGGNVAFLKTPAQWATNNPEEIMDGFVSEKTEYPIDRSGQSYEDYLRLLLYFSSKEEILLRTMDLIQINMQGTYNRDFLLRDYYTGFRFDAKANGKTFSYMEKY